MTSAVTGPPSSCASGSIVDAIIVSTAPANHSPMIGRGPRPTPDPNANESPQGGLDHAGTVARLRFPAHPTASAATPNATAMPTDIVITCG